jgi:hypothetical protein
MTYIHTVSYVVMIGQPVGRILPARGIRQGDPLSSYIFLVCAEALGSLFHHTDLSSISGVPTSKWVPCLSHLFFADDFLLFARQILWNGVD